MSYEHAHARVHVHMRVCKYVHAHIWELRHGRAEMGFDQAGACCKKSKAGEGKVNNRVGDRGVAVQRPHVCPQDGTGPRVVWHVCAHV